MWWRRNQSLRCLQLPRQLLGPGAAPRTKGAAAPSCPHASALLSSRAAAPPARCCSPGGGRGAALAAGGYSEACSFFPGSGSHNRARACLGLHVALWILRFSIPIGEAANVAKYLLRPCPPPQLLTQILSPRDGGEATSVPGMDGSWGLKVPFCWFHQ